MPKALWKWGCISTFFLFFLPISESGGCNEKPTNWSIFLCDLSIFEYKVRTKKCSNFILFAVNSTFFTLFHLDFFDDLFFCFFFLLNPPFFLSLKIFLPPRFSPAPIFKSLQKVGVVSPKKWGVLTPKIPLIMEHGLYPRLRHPWSWSMGYIPGFSTPDHEAWAISPASAPLIMEHGLYPRLQHPWSWSMGTPDHGAWAISPASAPLIMEHGLYPLAVDFTATIDYNYFLDIKNIKN